MSRLARSGCLKAGTSFGNVSRMFHKTSKTCSDANFDEAKVSEKQLADERRGQFRVLDIGKRPTQLELFKKRNNFSYVHHPSREKKMKPDQDWPSVWPGPRTFHPDSVPLPIRQGYPMKGMVVRGKKANAELMKIANFLHLTPPAIKRHCDSLKKYCTDWPEEFNDDELLDLHYPITEITSDYINASSSIRDNRSRIVTVRFQVSALYLDPASRDKFIRLVTAERYDPETDTVTLTADRCPYRPQNRDYCDYLLKACFYESQKREDWEQLVEERDRAVYDYSDEKLADDDPVVPVKTALSNLLNEGENVRTLNDYKMSVVGLFKLKDNLPHRPTEVTNTTQA